VFSGRKLFSFTNAVIFLGLPVTPFAVGCGEKFNHYLFPDEDISQPVSAIILSSFNSDYLFKKDTHRFS
jgi:hypothetical protein